MLIVTSTLLFRSSARYWSDDLSVRRNQDNQRDFEERAAAQMIALLTKRTGTENLLSKSFRQQHGCKQPKQPIGTFICTICTIAKHDKCRLNNRIWNRWDVRKIGG